MSNILKQIQHLADNDVKTEMVMQFVQEVQARYFRALRHASVDYELKSPRRASKLRIDLATLTALRNWQTSQKPFNLHLRHAWKILRQTGIRHKAVRVSRKKLKASESIVEWVLWSWD